MNFFVSVWMVMYLFRAQLGILSFYDGESFPAILSFPLNCLGVGSVRYREKRPAKFPRQKVSPFSLSPFSRTLSFLSPVTRRVKYAEVRPTRWRSVGTSLGRN